MSNLNRHPVRRAAAGVLAGALALSGGALVAAPSAFAAPGFQLDRVAGADRYATSAEAAIAFGASSNIILASGETGRAADALGASFLAGVRSAPVLLTAQAGLVASTRSALTTMRANGATTVTIVGGTAAVSDAVMAEVRALGFTVDRLAGDDRFGTAAAVVAAGEGASASNVGIVASGISTVDALAVGPLAFKGKHPVFLTRAMTIPDETLAAMRTAGVTSVYIVGGTAVVGAEVVAQLSAAGISVVERLAGNDRSATSVAIANELIADHGFTAATFNLASGANEGVDALSGAALSGKNNRVLLLTNTATNAGSVDEFTAARVTTLNATGRIFGGTAVVSLAIESAVETAGSATTSNQAFMITPAEAVVNTVSTGQLDNSGRRNYTVANPTSGKVHSIVLLDAANVSVAANGTVTISSATPVAANSGVSLEIVEGAFVQAADTTAGTTYFEVTPTGGELTFSIDSVRNDANVVPVVFFDADGDDMLDLNADGTPVAAEMFGVGGATMYVPAEAADNTTSTAANITVTRMDKDANNVVTADALYNYDSNDTFRLNGVLIDQARFEALLSAGDVISVVYRSDAANVSTFNVTTDVVTAPADVKTTVTTVSTDVYNVTVNWTASTQTDVTYTVVRTNTQGGATTVVATGVAGTSVTDQDVPDGTYTYTVVANASTSGVEATSAASESVVVPPVTPADPAPAVLANGAVVDVNTGGAGATAGDVWALTLGEKATVAPSAAIQVGNVIVENGVNGTIATSAAGDVVVVTLNSDLTGITYPATISAVTGIADSAGQALDFSADTSLEDNGPEIVTETADTGETTFTVTFNEAVIEASAENVSNYAYVSGTGAASAAPTSATLGTDGRTVTLVVPTAVAAGATVNPNGVVDTDGQASAQGAVVVEAAAAATDTTPPTFVSAVAGVGTLNMTVTYSEALNEGSVQAADYSLTLASGSVVSPTGATAAGNVVTLTFSGTNFAAGDTGTLNKVDLTDVLDLANNDQPDTDSVAFTTA